MPYVQRNWKGEITGLFAIRQPGYAEEELPDDHPDVVSFNEAHPIPPEMLRPLTPDERRRIQDDHVRITKEHDALRNAIWSFNSAFNELEIALSTLLHEALHVPKSKVAYAVYYSPNSFDARAEIVDNVIKQLIIENGRLEALSPLWASLYDNFRGTRTKRNSIAHGMPITIAIRGKSHVRLTSPVFDANRVGRHITETGQPPGLTASDIARGAQKARWLVERVDDVNRLLTTFHEDGNPTLPEKFSVLEAGLRDER